MRDKMPSTAAFVDELRRVFGEADVNRAIRSGIRDGDFWAVENGHIVGKPPCCRAGWEDHASFLVAFAAKGRKEAA